MASYPTKLATVNTKGLPEIDELAHPDSGDVTPSHGGAVPTGHEYEMPIQQRSYFRDPSPLRNATAPGPPTIPATPTTNGSTLPSSSRPPRARPLSMPPQPTGSTNSRFDEEPPTRTSRPSVSGSGEAGRTKSSARIIGDYTMTKTLGAGSMGKVKLATQNLTGEKLAIKIVPRSPNALSPPPYAAGTTLPPASVDPKSKEASKEIRTIREASLSLLLHHPYICGMRELIVHQHHYYMVFEYVSGGQMLDYIISHGRLRERVARKFARQIGSALEYLHKNSVVHRDLKIENILISQSGNIKLIDFGLSNLYNPQDHLATFCGSLYFAAPELLNAKVYTGPEVDVWSFGVVLYVLVCGRVPFDDQSMPALHAKIKRGVVEYPTWLSQECKSLLSRMLVTNPVLRATLTEVLNHPWMNRSYPHPPSSHLLPREPLRADDLDKDVVKHMTGFEFGTEEDIEGRLRDVLLSERYRRAVEVWERKKDGGRAGWRSESSFTHSESGALSTAYNTSNSTVATSYTPPAQSNSAQATLSPAASPTKKSSKRFSGLDYYRRKLFSGSTSPPTTPTTSPPQISYPTNSSPNSPTPPIMPLEREPLDPTHGFHPLVSIYYLVREKIERERVYGPGHFASSQLSLVGDELLPSNAAAVSHAAPEPPPKVGLPPSVPASPSATQATKPSAYNVPTPKLPAPPPSYVSATSYGVPETPSPTTTGFVPPPSAQPQPRARAPEAVMQHMGEGERGVVDLPKQAAGATGSPKPDMGLSTSASPAIKAPAATSHRRSHSLSQRVGAWEVGGGGTGRKEGAAMGLPPVGELERVPQTAGAEFGTFAQKIGARTVAVDEARREQQETSGDATLGTGTGANLVRRFGTLLGSRRERGGERDREDRLRESRSVPAPGLAAAAAQDRASATPEAEDKENQSSQHRRAATVFDRSPGTAGRHARRTSLQGTMGKMWGAARDRQGTGRFDDVWEEGEEDRASTEREGTEEHGESGGHGSGRGEDGVKPATLKGVFSVSTTSSKSPSAIKADIRRVLDRMQVQYQETATGFVCVHQPSIDLSSVNKEAEGGLTANGGRGPVRRKTSRLSLGRMGKKKDPEAASQRSGMSPTMTREKEKEREPTGGAPALRASTSGGSSSFFTLPLGTTAPATPGGNASTTTERPVSPGGDTLSGSPGSPNRGKFLPPIPRDFVLSPTAARGRTGESGDNVSNVLFENSGASDLVVRFEVNVVKVPLLPLHGIQFRRVGGNGWQYQMLARRVLTELKL